MSDKHNDSSDSSKESDLEGTPLSLEAMLDILANRQRWYFFQCLKESSENTISFEEGYEYVLAQIAKSTGERPSPDEIQIGLHHRHIPLLEDSGVVQYDFRSKTIRYHQNNRLEELFERIQDFQRNGTESSD